MEQLTGKLHSIETFGTVDGPGVRFVVFFQGCPMRCRFCHNPDTWDISRAQLSPTADEVLEKMTRNLPFYRGGGITATGGEPMCQMDFLTELFKKAHALGIHTALDTSGITFSENAEYLEKLDTLLALTDLVMLDIKHTDEDEHISLTGASGMAAVAFARYLCKKQIPLRIRHVLVPGLTDGEAHLLSLGRLLGELQSSGVLEGFELLPYHRMGEGKYEKLGIPYTLPGVEPPTAEEIARAYEIIGYRPK